MYWRVRRDDQPFYPRPVECPLFFDRFFWHVFAIGHIGKWLDFCVTESGSTITINFNAPVGPSASGGADPVLYYEYGTGYLDTSGSPSAPYGSGGDGDAIYDTYDGSNANQSMTAPPDGITVPISPETVYGSYPYFAMSFGGGYSVYANNVSGLSGFAAGLDTSQTGYGSGAATQDIYAKSENEYINFTAQSGFISLGGAYNEPVVDADASISVYLTSGAHDELAFLFPLPGTSTGQFVSNFHEGGIVYVNGTGAPGTGSANAIGYGTAGGSAYLYLGSLGGQTEAVTFIGMSLSTLESLTTFSGGIATVSTQGAG